MSFTLRKVESADIAPPEDLSKPPRHKSDGRPHIMLPDGSKRMYYSRASNAGAVLESKEGLMKWKARLAAWGAVHYPRLADPLQDITDLDDPESKTILNKVAAQLQDAAGASRKAEKGTAFHTVTEAIDRGEDVGWLPESMLGMAREYSRLVDELAKHREYGVEFIEEFCVNDEEKIAGTPDRIVSIDGEPAVVDVKTMGSMDYGMGKIAMQMYAYGGAQRYNELWDDTGYGTMRLPWHQSGEPITRGFILWVPQGREYAAISQEIDLTQGRRGMQIAREVKEWENFWKRKANSFRAEMSFGEES